MESRRLQKVAETYRNEVSHLLITQVEDASLDGLTITHVRLTPDMRLARVYFSVAAGKSQASKALRALLKQKGYLRKELAVRVKMKHTPDLQFFYDEADDLTKNVESLFHQLDAEKSQKPETDIDSDSDSDDR